MRAVLPRLASRLRADGGELVVLGSRRDLDAYESVLDGAERVTAPAYCDAPAAGALWYLARADAAARAARADVLLLPAANRRITLRATVPTVAVVHDLAQLRVARKYDPLRMAYLRYGVVAALRSAHALVAVSGATRDDIERALGASSPPIHVVHNGVDAARFAPRSPDHPSVVEARARTGLHARPYLLYAARLEHPGKNHVRLIEAFAKSRARTTHVLALAGADWGGLDLVRERIATLALERSVKLLGYVDDVLMPGLVGGSDAVVMVGLHEGFGLPALEALAAGRPLCAASAGALPEVVGELGAMCDPEDVTSIARALDRAVSDGALRARCAAEGPPWSGAHGWDRTVEGLLRACREVVTQ